MYVHYRDIENDDTVDGLLINFALYFYARQVLLYTDDTERAVIEQTMRETATKLQLNSYYTQIAGDDVLKQHIYTMDKAISRLGKDFCNDRLRQLLSNESFEILW
jgi:hypothetical protein